MQDEKHVVFSVGNEFYSIEITSVKAIEQDYTVIPVPHAPENVSGLMNLRGEIIPIYSLRARFGMEESAKVDCRLLVTKVGQITMAFEVDTVIGIETIEPGQKKGIPILLKTENTSYIGDIVNLRDKIVVNISLRNILSESEIEDISAMLEENA